jgi:hypothetical protein
MVVTKEGALSLLVKRDDRHSAGPSITVPS